MAKTPLTAHVVAALGAAALLSSFAPTQEAVGGADPSDELALRDPLELRGMASLSEEYPRLLPALEQRYGEGGHPFAGVVLALSCLRSDRLADVGVTRGNLSDEQWRQLEAEVTAWAMVRYAQAGAWLLVSGLSLELELVHEVTEDSVAACWERAAAAVPRPRSKAEAAATVGMLHHWVNFALRTGRFESRDAAIQWVARQVEDLKLAFKVPRKLDKALAKWEEAVADNAANVLIRRGNKKLDEPPPQEGLLARFWEGEADDLPKLLRTRPLHEEHLAPGPADRSLEFKWTWEDRPEGLAQRPTVLRADGVMSIEQAGLYRLVVAFDDYPRLELGGEVAVNAWGSDAGGTIVGSYYTVPVWLEAHTALRLDLADTGGAMSISMGLDRYEGGGWHGLRLELRSN